jgi:hypothetical protein
MSHSLRRWTVCALVAACWCTAASLASAQDTKARKGRTPDELKGAPKDERVSGVILKVEDLPAQGTAGSAPRGKRVTINTAVVWRDWVRDQASAKPTASPKEAAREGNNSVATKGQPASKDTLVIVDLLPDSKVETRFRSSTDETGEGAKTPEGAAAAEKDPADTSRPKTPARASAKPPQFDMASLKPGLFVDAEFRRDTNQSQNRASTIYVVRPVGGAETSAKDAAPGP